ncbi:aminopeptidase P family protein [Exilibacterium tricleocarpae]|uniref:Aminopeptidase P family protein n=1 Tax=Exilibacterium tricleocarpae TaxID=2591008 RepID=A0A545SY40_9GAMM|nr:aminopeptidase P family protein [Exilibacterium tricleocarpae]TQV69873.1 aminopeptidase P family protein [Exilibacterium tricleocarpae]
MPTAELPVDCLQRWLRDNALQGLLIPSSDEYQNEYVPACARRLHWATGFSGSAGRALVLQDSAALFVDGRYTAQARQQVPVGRIEVLGHQPEVLEQWLDTHLEPDSVVGFDPQLQTLAEVKTLRKQLCGVKSRLSALPANPIDELWCQRPDAVATPVALYPLEYAGTSSAEKRSGLGNRMAELGLDYYLATAPEEVAWLLNIRAWDLATVPVPLSYALLARSGEVQWFIEAERVPPLVESGDHFGDGVAVQPPAAVASVLDGLGAGSVIGLNLKRTPYYLAQRIDKLGGLIDTDLVEMEKAKKNPREIYGALAAQKHDCLAVIKFLSWLETTVAERSLTELDAADKITRIRRECAAFLGVSFEPISASGPNSALAHYRVSERTNRVLNDEAIYLIDSGGQYYGGTTDITRTVALYTPSRQQKRAYTLVLKGHIALAMCRFPAGTSGSQLDVLARQHLWQQGMDYGHGTGHGVGSYLSVHEGPAAIRPAPSATPLCEGMILSNEPGYYEEGSYGIRIENLVVVKKSALDGFLEFDTISHVPMDHRLLDFSLLTEQEKGWLKRYHCEIKTRFPPELDDVEKQWLADAIEPFISC